MKRDFSRSVQRALTGFAAGVMVAASIWSLLIPAMDQVTHMGRWAFLPAVVGFWLGILFLLLLDHIIPDGLNLLAIVKFTAAYATFICKNTSVTTNADVEYLYKVGPNIMKVTGLDIIQTTNLIDGTQNLDRFSFVSGIVKTCAINLSKIAKRFKTYVLRTYLRSWRN